ncbi:MAG: C-GCAxxG-C-C family protein [Sphaerochaetaceae bacterium]
MVEKYVSRALMLSNSGYNCCQATLCCFKELLETEEIELYKLGEAFGRGMGNYEGICGAISGTLLALSSLFSNGNHYETSKENTYRIATNLIETFREKNGSTVCKELLGIETNKVLRSCIGCIEDAVTIACKIIERERNE